MDLSGTQPTPGGSLVPSHLLEQIVERVEQWLARRWVPVAINMAALALLSFTLARGTWRLLTPPQSVAEAPIAVANENRGDYNLQALASANLFGQLPPTAAKGPVSLDAIPLSSLNLVLSGVMMTSTGSFALISADGNPELPFGVGQEILAGVSLYAVYRDRVLIRRGGATETLMLKDTSPDLTKGSIITSTPPPASVDGSGLNPNSSRARRRERNRQFFDVDRQQLNQQMQRPEVLSQALMVPNAGGGFLVREIQPGSVYEKLGLKVGDVIASVNGQAVNTMEDVMRLYQQVASTSNLQLSVKRAGRNETLVYNIQ